MRVEHIAYPWVFAGGMRINVNQIEEKTSLHVNAELEQVNGKYKVVGNSTDENCVGGVCPVK